VKKSDWDKKIVFCVVFCRSMIVFFLLVTVLPALALQWGSSNIWCKSEYAILQG